MEEAKEDLIAAILQAKKCCISIQQKAWEHEKLVLRPQEDIFVRRYLYGVILSRRIRYYNGVSNEISQRGAICRMGEHLYGFEGIRDLSFQAAVDVDRFFGREPHIDLLYQSPYPSPYHFLYDYVEGYSRKFFKSSLSRSAHDLSEWQRHLHHSPTISGAVSHGELDLTREMSHRESVMKSTLPSDPYQDDVKFLQGPNPEFSATMEGTFSSRQSSYPSAINHGRFDSNGSQDWSHNYDRVAFHQRSFNYPSISSTNTFSQNISAYDKIHEESRTFPNYSEYHNIRRQNSLLFKGNRDLIREFDDSLHKVNSSLVHEENVQQTVQRPWLEESIESTTSSRYSTIENFLERNSKTTETRSPSNTNSHLEYEDRKKEDGLRKMGIGATEYKRSSAEERFATMNRAMDGEYLATSKVDNVLEKSETFLEDKIENSSSELSDSETIRATNSFNSEATLVPAEIDSSHEVIYDDVAEDPEHVYDPVANDEVRNMLITR
ncbi:unnamed protein product [Angiostrongylus costaricensis]|uniref:DCD domain-containing protein n=1 Tax=Angiostrongylus costaricensis TaxID=334426 RepID=A0A158PFG6_ANGCS|nr:unnamed protein product [Angiostrongylus costaricensis]